jgi:hypothetical protein
MTPGLAVWVATRLVCLSAVDVGIVAFYFVTKDIYRPGRDAGAGK